MLPRKGILAPDSLTRVVNPSLCEFCTNLNHRLEMFQRVAKPQESARMEFRCPLNLPVLHNEVDAFQSIDPAQWILGRCN